MGCSTRPRRCSPERVRPAPTCSPGRVVGWCVPPCHTRALALGYEAGTRVIVLRRARLCARKGRQRVAPSTVLCCLRWEVSSRTAEGGVGVGGSVGARLSTHPPLSPSQRMGKGGVSAPPGGITYEAIVTQHPHPPSSSRSLLGYDPPAQSIGQFVVSGSLGGTGAALLLGRHFDVQSSPHTRGRVFRPVPPPSFLQGAAEASMTHRGPVVLSVNAGFAQQSPPPPRVYETKTANG